MSIKKGDVFKVDSAWWKKNKPLTLKSTGLGKALEAYETLKEAAAKMAKAGNYDKLDEKSTPLDQAANALTVTLPAAVTKASNACNKTLHSDAIDCLKTAKTAFTNEGKVIAKLQSDFDKLYKKTKSQFMTAAKSAADDNALSKEAAHNAYKTAEGQLKELADLAKKAPKMTEEKAREAASEAVVVVMTITEQLETITEMAEVAEAEYRKVSGFPNKREMLAAAEAREMIQLCDAAQVARNAVNTYRDKAALFLTTAQAHLVTIEKVVPSDNRKTPTAKDVLPKVKKLDSNLTELCSRGREMNNTVVSFIQNLRLMTKDAEQAAKIMRMPATDFPVYAQKAETDGPKFLSKIVKLESQCKSMTKTVLGSIDRALLADPLLKDLVANIKQSTQNLKDLNEGGGPKKDEMNKLIKKVYVDAGW